MDPGRIHIHVVEQGFAGLRLVPVGVAVRQETLVTPPELDPPPVDRAPGRRLGDSPVHDRGDPATGQHDLSDPAAALYVDQPGDEPGRDGVGQALGVAVDQDRRASS